MTYFNTNHESGDTLAKSIDVTKTQEEQILEIWKSRPYATMTACQFWNNHYSHVPLTSVRRAFCNLKDAGKLEKLDEMRIGIYGKNVHAWKLKIG